VDWTFKTGDETKINSVWEKVRAFTIRSLKKFAGVRERWGFLHNLLEHTYWARKKSSACLTACYYKRIWFKCSKIHRTARTFNNGKDAFGVKHNAEMKIVRHSPGQNIAGKVLFWGAAGKLTVMSTRWRWAAGCFIRAKPRPEMHGCPMPMWNGASTIQRGSMV